MEPVDDVGAPVENSWKSRFSRRIASKKISEEFEYLAKIYNKLELEDLQGEKDVRYALQHASSSSQASEFRDPGKKEPAWPPGSKVCIVGAGMAGKYYVLMIISLFVTRLGLYIAMILDALEIPNLDYEILEGSDRIGGRVYTHHFSETKHDYYDVRVVPTVTGRPTDD